MSLTSHSGCRKGVSAHRNWRSGSGTNCTSQASYPRRPGPPRRTASSTACASDTHEMNALRADSSYRARCSGTSQSLRAVGRLTVHPPVLCWPSVVDGGGLRIFGSRMAADQKVEVAVEGAAASTAAPSTSDTSNNERHRTNEQSQETHDQRRRKRCPIQADMHGRQICSQTGRDNKYLLPAALSALRPLL